MSDTAELPGGIVTFLFTDMESSTQIARMLRDDWPGVMTEHQRLLREAFTDHGGREVDTQGEAFFFAFTTAQDAVRAALDGRRALAEQAWPGGIEVRVRIGLHTGQAEPKDGRYFGLAVHRAARIMSAGRGGQVLLSASTYGLLADDPPPDVDFRDLGERELKGLDRPERLYEVLPQDVVERRESARRVVVADDSVLLREGIARLLTDAGFEVVATAVDANELLAAVDSQRPTVAITDIKMPPTHTDEGLVAAEKIRRDHPDIGVLVLSQYLDSRYAMRLLEHYPERVGYLLKDRVSDAAVLSDAVRRIAEGECVVDPTIVSRLMKRAREDGPLADLDDREVELLSLIAEGRSDEAIGERLDVDRSAVGEAVGKVFSKLGVQGSPDELRRIVYALDVLRS
jgi:class 3 adenylate cyclase/DNA-binding NarL/FixJ family response regulator